MSKPGCLSHSFLRFARTVILGIVISNGLASMPAQAQCTPGLCSFSTCHTPAKGVAGSLWDQLRPADTGTLPGNRDSTDFTEFHGWEQNPYWRGLDIEGNFMFTAGSNVSEVWSIGSNPGNPTRSGVIGWNASNLEGGSDHTFAAFQDVDAPAGNTNIYALAGDEEIGVVVVDSTTKSQPIIRYQNHGFRSLKIYSATIGGQAYAFSAQTGINSGLFAYNLTVASQQASRCTEKLPGSASACPGVFLGPLGSERATAVGGAGEYVISSGGILAKGLRIHRVSNPSSPVLVMDALAGDSINSVALWQQGASFYAAILTSSQVRIYNVSCITNGFCQPGAVVWSQNLSAKRLTFSTSGSTPFLYVAQDADDCLQGNQNEWLLDVSTPSSPVDISPQGTQVINGEAVSYWGWYYRRNGVHGFNRVSPAVGKFRGDYFYRAAKAILDIHERTGASPPVANFNFSPANIYPGTGVNFTDTSTGGPTSWNWTFNPDGSPGSSTVKNPSGVTFATSGNKNISLQACNTAGCDNENKSLTVLPPEPQIASVSANPSTANVCQPITFNGNGVTGQPVLTLSWQVKNDQGVVVDSAGNINPFTWDTEAASAPAGTYTAELTATNSSGAETVASPVVTLQALPPLPGSGNFTPTNQPFTAGTVQFNVNVAGATEWSWDFGEGAGYGPFSNDPVTGPAPSHTYSIAGNYDVRVRVRNCENQTPQESNPLTVVVNNITPLAANFRASLFCQAGTCFADVGQSINFADLSTGPPDTWDYDWDGNGTFEDAGNTSPVTAHTYSSAGSFKPVLRVRRGSETNTYTGHDTIVVSSGGPAPTAAIGISGPNSGQPGNPLNFTASAVNCAPNANGWSWSHTGSGTSTTGSISISWSTAGIKTITATNTGCTGATGTKTVSISTPGGGGGGPLAAAFTFSPSNPQAGEEVTFDGSSSTGGPDAYNWDFGDGNLGSGAVATHTYASAGTYQVELEVTEQAAGCPFGVCAESTTKTVVVGNGGPPPPPPPSASYSVNVPCSGVAALVTCAVEAGQQVTFTDTSTGTISSRSWDFGDGNTAAGGVVAHAFSSPGTYLAVLTVTGGEETSQAVKTFEVTGPELALDTVLLPWVVQGQAALDQKSELFVHNPAAKAVDVTLRFFKRPVPDDPAPEFTFNLAPGATAYYPDVLQDPFGESDVSGFLQVQTSDREGGLPVVSGSHRTFQGEESFGQGVPGVTFNDFPRSVPTEGPDRFDLIGLNDNADRLSFFGITNPNPNPATVQLTFFNRLGEEIGTPQPPVNIASFGQRQFQLKTLRDKYGVINQTDYRVEIELLAGGPIYPYGQNLRNATEDPSFVRAADPTAGNLFMIGTLATSGLNASEWRTDVVVTNLNDSPVTTSMQYQNVGNPAQPMEPVDVTILAGETLRLENVLVTLFDVDPTNSIGLITFETKGVEGSFPLIQAETYDDADPTQRFGQGMPALVGGRAAEGGERQILTGLEQDDDFLTVLWLFNPSSGPGLYDVIYRDLGGAEIGRLSNFKVGAGKVRQIAKALHPEGLSGRFTVQIVVRSGSLLSASQVSSNANNDPFYQRGVTR